MPNQLVPKRRSPALAPRKAAFLKKAIARHGDRYDYSKCNYTSASSKVEIICLKHGSFFQTPDNHTHGQGCPLCGKETRGKERITLASSLFLEQLKEKNYEVTKSIESATVDAHFPLEIRCCSHDIVFKQTPQNLIKDKTGCKLCKGEKISSSKKVAYADFLERARALHGVRYEYDNSTYDGLMIPMRIICPEHGEFFQIPTNHLQGNGCWNMDIRRQLKKLLQN